MQTLSVVLAVYNEEKNLARCLDSVRNFADEIIIVDGSSTDKTVEIAKKYTAKILVTSNPPIFHINKQKAIDLATKDWILQLDADEVVSKELKEEIQKKVLTEKNNEYSGYWTPRKNWFLGRFLLKGGQYPDYTLRLYKRGKGHLPQKDVHEQAEIEGEVGYLVSALLHYPYENFAVYKMKWDRYNRIFASQMRERQRNMNLLGKVFFAINNLIFQPIFWFLKAYLRHKGFMDGWAGFVFAFYSALRFPAAYLISLQLHEKIASK
ncbi:MAG TPA: glycosyltransferase family 2 protein [Patescibacteria group bacterium]|nr:glycosyltransferase family 2 protein [Patescibacteria group bacterium]